MIPTHNRRAMLMQAIASVLAQTVTDLEIIVVDDGSDDDTTSTVESLGDARVVVIRSTTAQGVSDARNRGIAAATGEWIAFLDDDDLWAPGKLERQIGAARADARDWAFSGSVTVDGSLAVIAGCPPPDASVIVAMLPIRNCVPAGASNVLVRRSLLSVAGTFDVRLRHLADWDMWIRLAAFGLPAMCSTPDVAYRLHGGNASEDAAAIDHELALMAGRYVALRGKREIDRAFVLRWAAWNLLRSGRPGAAARTYARAMIEGDLMSAARAAVAVADRRVVQRRLRRNLNVEWSEVAARWLAAFA